MEKIIVFGLITVAVVTLVLMFSGSFLFLV